MLIELACTQPYPAKPWEKEYRLNEKVCNHSPNGFNHGYGGSGPAQLALAICLELFGKKAAVQFYQDFKWEHIATLGHYTQNEAQHEAFTVLLDVSKYANLAEQ